MARFGLPQPFVSLGLKCLYDLIHTGPVADHLQPTLKKRIVRHLDQRHQGGDPLVPRQDAHIGEQGVDLVEAHLR